MSHIIRHFKHQRLLHETSQFLFRPHSDTKLYHISADMFPPLLLSWSYLICKSKTFNKCYIMHDIGHTILTIDIFKILLHKGKDTRLQSHSSNKQRHASWLSSSGFELRIASAMLISFQHNCVDDSDTYNNCKKTAVSVKQNSGCFGEIRHT